MESLMNLAHLHIVLNHFPTIGTVIGLGLFIVALVIKSDDLKQASLGIFLIMALLAIPTYLSGSAAQQAIAERDGVSEARIETHQDAALLASVFLGITGTFAWLGLWQFRRFSRPANWNVLTILILSIVTVGLMARTGTMGGEISHPEIRSGPETIATEGTESVTASVALFVVTLPWAWPAGETLHFVGMSLLFGVVLLVNLRMLGMLKNVSYPTLHRLLPWGILGFVVNLVTGMLFFIADSGRYIAMPGFPWKIAFIVLAGVNVIYFTVFDEAWTLGAGDDAPLKVKVIAASTIGLWVGIIFFGRMLPYLGGGG